MRRGSAIWQATRPSHGSWLAEYQEVLFAAVGPQQEFIVIAVLHTLDEVVALHTPGNIIGVPSRQESGRQTRKKATSRDSGPRYLAFGATPHEQRLAQARSQSKSDAPHNAILAPVGSTSHSHRQTSFCVLRAGRGRCTCHFRMVAGDMKELVGKGELRPSTVSHLYRKV